jgi:hypothetical protein
VLTAAAVIAMFVVVLAVSAHLISPDSQELCTSPLWQGQAAPFVPRQSCGAEASQGDARVRQLGDRDFAELEAQARDQEMVSSTRSVRARRRSPALSDSGSSQKRPEAVSYRDVAAFAQTY